MIHVFRIPLAVVLALLVAVHSADTFADDLHWSNWRGTAQAGLAPAGEYPTTWSPTSIRWKCALAGRGGSTPVVCGKQVFLTCGDGSRNLVVGIALEDGRIRWTTTLGKDRGGKHKVKGGGSHPSIVTDGSTLFAYFRSGDLGAIGMDGKVIWQVNLQQKYGEDTLWWDLGSSPVLTERAVIVAVMQTGSSYLVALDKASGKELWKQDRMLDAPLEAAQSYSTPLVTQLDNQTVLLALGADHLTCHRADDGAELWRVGGFNPQGEKYFRSIASPVLADGVVVCPYARGNSLWGIRLTDHQVVWKRDDLGCDVPTPAAVGGQVYLCTDKGRLVCLRSSSGETIWEGELPKSRMGFSSSPLVAGENIYLIREDGTTFVVADRGPFRVLAENPPESTVNEAFLASPVPIPNGLLLRHQSLLVAVGRAP